MARTPKPSGSKRQSGPRTKTTRRIRSEKKIRYLVVTEGVRTEPAYFEQLQRFFPESCQAQLIVRTRNKSWNPDPVYVVRKCIEFKKQDEQKHTRSSDADVAPYVGCFAVIDVDRWNEESKDTGTSQLHEAINLAKRNNIHVVITNPKFEAWLLWHATDHSESSSTSLTEQCLGLKLLDDKLPASDFPYDKFVLAAQRAVAHGKLPFNESGTAPASAIPQMLSVIGAM